MKSFKSFITENKEEKKHTIPHAIHFKHIPPEENDNRLEEDVLDWFKSKPKTTLPHISAFLNQNLNSHLGSNPNEITQNLHSDQPKVDRSSHNALIEYSGSGSYDMNHHLVASNGILHKKHFQLADGIDQAIRKNKIRKELNTYSGVAFDPRTRLNKNKQMRSPAYISTTHDPEVAFRFATSKGKLPEKHIIHLHLKPGDPAVHMGEHSIYEDEHETVLGRGAVLQHHGTTEYHGKTKVGTYVKYVIHHMTVNRTPEQNSLYSRIKRRKNETIH